MKAGDEIRISIYLSIYLSYFTIIYPSFPHSLTWAEKDVGPKEAVTSHCTLYPVTAAPPLCMGGDHHTAIWVSDRAVARASSGAEGAVTYGDRETKQARGRGMRQSYDIRSRIVVVIKLCRQV